MTIGSGWLDVSSYKLWARIPLADTTDDAAIGQACMAAENAITQRCVPLFTNVDVDIVPADVLQAGLLWANRLLARRNSPDGLVGVVELGVAQVRSYDLDIINLLRPWTSMVLA